MGTVGRAAGDHVFVVALLAVRQPTRHVGWTSGDGVRYYYPSTARYGCDQGRLLGRGLYGLNAYEGGLPSVAIWASCDPRGPVAPTKIT